MAKPVRIRLQGGEGVKRPREDDDKCEAPNPVARAAELAASEADHVKACKDADAKLLEALGAARCAAEERSEALSRRESHLEELERELARRQAAFDAGYARAEKTAAAGADRVHLDFRGHRVWTTRRALLAIPDSYFMHMLSFEKPDDGCYMIDRDPTFVPAIIPCLCALADEGRTKKGSAVASEMFRHAENLGRPAKGAKWRDDFCAELRFYSLEALMDMEDGEDELSASRNVEQCVVFSWREERDQRMLDLVTAHMGTKLLVFANTKKACDDIVDNLWNNGFDRAMAIHGDKEEVDRRNKLERFRQLGDAILVVTGAGCVGDFRDIHAEVVNYHFPPTMEHYVHRIGLASRKAHTLFSPADHGQAKKLVRVMCKAGSVPPQWLVDWTAEATFECCKCKAPFLAIPGCAAECPRCGDAVPL